MAAPSNQNVTDDLPEDIWMLRPCEIYREEYSDCSSVRGRFHQYYTDGSYRDCQKWKEDYKNCMQFRKTGSRAAAEAIIDNEKERRKERLQAARGNDVWEYRRDPPKDWNKELPQWTKEHENSVLARVQKEWDRKRTMSQPETVSRCCIS